MKNSLKLAVLLLLLVTFTNCSKKDMNSKSIVFEIEYQTRADTSDNVDSPTFYKINSDSSIIITTAKSTNRLLVHNSINGEFVKYVGSSGNGELQFLRPNGIFVIDSLLFVVERDNRRIQVLSLPSFTFKAFIAENDLVKPYGIYINKIDSVYNIFITDNYETAEGNIPPNAELNKRVLKYSAVFAKINRINFVKHFGDTIADGTLKIVESIFGDEKYNNLLIAEEKEDETCLKVYDFDGNYKNITFGKGLFKYQVEGISLYQNGDNGFWIITDQDLHDNIFHIFSRIDFSHIGYFKVKNTANTDGIWLTQEAFKNFPNGAFIAVNNDQNISAVNLINILNEFKIE